MLNKDLTTILSRITPKMSRPEQKPWIGIALNVGKIGTDKYYQGIIAIELSAIQIAIPTKQNIQGKRIMLYTAYRS